MPQVTGILETSLYVNKLARAAKFYEVVIGLKRMTGDDRFCAYSVAGKYVLLLFLRGGTVETIQVAGVNSATRR